MRLELTRVGLLVELANHYTTKGAFFFFFFFFFTPPMLLGGMYSEHMLIVLCRVTDTACRFVFKFIWL